MSKLEQAQGLIEDLKMYRPETGSFERAIAALEQLHKECLPHHTYTVFCRESSNQGTTWIDTVEVANGGQSASELLAEIRALATANCAVDWGWPDSEGITCYCIIPGEPDVLFFEDLGVN